jgi:hypothetical protein
MSQNYRILKLRIDVTKLDKSVFYQGKQGIYCDLDVFVNDEPDQYGYIASAKQDLGKERRQAGEKAPYCGNGKWLETRQAPAAKPAPQPKHREDFDNDDSSGIPF